MPVYKNWNPLRFTPDTPVEKHYHFFDETWLVTKGRCRAYAIHPDGRREDFELEAGDIWLIEAGIEHGCEACDEGVEIFPFPGTLPEGTSWPGHSYMEQEHVIPKLVLEKVPTDRYRKPQPVS